MKIITLFWFENQSDKKPQKSQLTNSKNKLHLPKNNFPFPANLDNTKKDLGLLKHGSWETEMSHTLLKANFISSLAKNQAQWLNKWELIT